MLPELPHDVVSLIMIQLFLSRDFDTLFNCAMASKHLAFLALAYLYRGYEVSPVTNRGRDEAVELPLGKWITLWRSIILSSFGKTAYPYCQFIRALDFTDLDWLLQDLAGPDAYWRNLFSEGEVLTPIVNLRQSRSNSGHANRNATLAAIGDALSTRAPMIEELNGPIYNQQLSQWLPKLSRLQRLSIWDGIELRDLGPVLKHHCPKFRMLQFYHWISVEFDPDSCFAAFLCDLKPQSLETLEVFSRSPFGPETFLALSRCQGAALTELILNDLPSTSMRHLALLKGCTNLVKLHLSQDKGAIDLETNYRETFLEIIAWLRESTKLKQINFKNMLSAPALLAPVLLEENIQLHELEVTSFPNERSDVFYQALSAQSSSLRSLYLQGSHQDPEAFWQDHEAMARLADTLVDSITKLPLLTDLNLKVVSDLFQNGHILRLAAKLPLLETLWTSGYNITDFIWSALAELKVLRRLDIYADIQCTTGGILDYISRLGPGNQGLLLAVNGVQAMTDEEQNLVREAILQKVEGRFDYQQIRDLDADFGSESDSD